MDRGKLLMANYKVVDADQLDADLASVAASIRAKAGTTGEMAFPAGFKSVVEGIQTGGAGGDIPSAETAEFGRLKVVSNTAPAGKSWFNGVLLPDIPADVLAQYPYAWIRKHTANNQYQLILAASPFYYYNGSVYCSAGDSAPKQWYDVTISTADTATAWTFNKQTTGSFPTDDARPIMWSNHDLPNGSATSSNIYFEGTEPIKEQGVDYGDFVSGSEIYVVTIGAINDIAHQMQKNYGTYDLFTGAELRDILSRCYFYERSTADSVQDLASLNYETSAIVE
jgi:hypothetical protein